MTIRLTLLTILEVATFAVGLIYFLYHIVTGLERIGALGNSFLGKIRFGVRAIEKETSQLGSQVVLLNQGLAGLTEQLGTVDRHLEAVARTLQQRREVQP